MLTFEVNFDSLRDKAVLIGSRTSSSRVRKHLIRPRIQAGISGNPKGKARDPWSWSPRREPKDLAELEMS